MGDKVRPKFKSGDRVKDKGGREGVVKSVPGMPEYDQYDFSDADKGFLLEGGSWSYQEDWELVSSKSKKEFPPKFLLKYDLDEDPIEEFATLPEVRKRIKQLVAEKTSLKRDSIVVYEIKRKMSVKLDTSITIK